MLRLSSLRYKLLCGLRDHPEGLTKAQLFEKLGYKKQGGGGTEKQNKRRNGRLARRVHGLNKSVIRSFARGRPCGRLIVYDDPEERYRLDPLWQNPSA